MALLLLFLAAWLPRDSGTDASFRGLKVLPDGRAWASGTKGTFLAIGGKAMTVPGAEGLDFRGLDTLDGRTIWLMSSGAGEKSRVYRSVDGGAVWSLLFTNPEAAGFFDSIHFWDARRGIILGDAVDGRFTIFTTSDGGVTWQHKTGPTALADEGAFAASNTCLAVRGKSEAWFGTGGARVFHSLDGGASWEVAQTPLRHDSKAAGVFSVAFDGRNGVAVGGDYGKPGEDLHNVAISRDSGRTWSEPALRPGGYRSAVAWNGKVLITTGTSGTDLSRDGGRTWKPVEGAGYNALGFAGERGWAAGPKGSIARWAR